MTDYEIFKGQVKQAIDTRNSKRQAELEAMNPKMYDDAYAELSSADYCEWIEEQEDKKDWDFSRPIEI